MEDANRGRLLIIGGAEDKDGKRTILKIFMKLAAKTGHRRIVIVTAAAENPNRTGDSYRSIFNHLGADRVELVNITNRQAAVRRDAGEMIEGATGIFFTGGDQLRITSLLGGTPVGERLKRASLRGAVIAGTSAGAAAMSSTMIVGGSGEDAPGSSGVRLAPGMNFIQGMTIDQHFAQRGRIGRLLEVIAQNPGLLGVGIDENTAVIADPGRRFEVAGENTVTVLDGSGTTYTGASEDIRQRALGIFDVSLHILAPGHAFDLEAREPRRSDDDDH